MTDFYCFENTHKQIGSTLIGVQDKNDTSTAKCTRQTESATDGMEKFSNEICNIFAERNCLPLHGPQLPPCAGAYPSWKELGMLNHLPGLSGPVERPHLLS
jgi:hypothetical protein